MCKKIKELSQGYTQGNSEEQTNQTHSFLTNHIVKALFSYHFIAGYHASIINFCLVLALVPI